MKNAATRATITARTASLPLFMAVFLLRERGPAGCEAIPGSRSPSRLLTAPSEELCSQVHARALPDVAQVGGEPLVAGGAAAAVHVLQETPVERGHALHPQVDERPVCTHPVHQ